jgi:hypothetical protein
MGWLFVREGREGWRVVGWFGVVVVDVVVVEIVMGRACA